MKSKLSWPELGVFKCLVLVSIVALCLPTACTKGDEIIPDEEIVAEKANEESDTTEDNNDSSDDENDTTSDDENTDDPSGDEDDNQGDDSGEDGNDDSSDEGESEEDDAAESEDTDNETVSDSEFAFSLSDSDFDGEFKEPKKIYINLESKDVSEMSRIKVIGYPNNKWIGLQTQETHDKFILVDVSNSDGQVAVGGQNNTIVIIGMESMKSKKLIAFDEIIKGGQVTKAQGNVYIELFPALDNRTNAGTRILVYLGTEASISDEAAQEHLQRVLDNNVFEDTGWI